MWVVCMDIVWLCFSCDYDLCLGVRVVEGLGRVVWFFVGKVLGYFFVESW